MTQDDKQTPVEVDAEELRRIEDESELAAAKERRSPASDPGDPGGTGGTGGTTHEQDD
jgi:hypothetical protein